MHSGGSRWSRWVGAAALAALLAGAGLWSRSSPPAPPTEAATRPEAPVPAAEKEAPPPRYRAESVARPSGAPVEVVRADAERASLAEFAARAVVPLTPEEEALLREARAEDLGQLIARAERDFREASPALREERERHYLLAMNLAAKLTPVETAGPDARTRAAQARYLQALVAEQVKWAGLPQDEQRRRQDAFKDDFFRTQEERK